jgi:hypothetical protein
MAHVERLEEARAEQELLAALEDGAPEEAAMVELAPVPAAVRAAVMGMRIANRTREFR